jgi:hypothetical protein
MRKLLILSLVLVFAVAAQAEYRWQFNDGSGTIATNTGSAGVDGTLTNGGTSATIPTWTTDAAEGSYALSFASWNVLDYVDVAAITPPSDDFSIALHAKPNSYSDYPYFVSTTSSWSMNNNGFRVVYSTSDRIEFSGSGYRVYSDPCAITAGVWQEIKVNYSKTGGGATILVDDVDVTATTASAPVSYVNGANGHIGFRTGDKGDYYGLMDDVRVTPEPMTMALLGLGAFGVLRRRRS